MTSLRLVFALALALPALVRAGIPQPDVVLYGTLRLGGETVLASQADVTITARVDGVDQPVGHYRMGDNSAAGDQYVLRIKMESLADGSEQGNDAAVIGQTVDFFAQVGTDPEQSVGNLRLTRAGLIKSLNLPAIGGLTGDIDRDGDVDLADFLELQRCFGGPGVSVAQGCQPADLDGDGDVDLADVVAFLSALIASP